MIGSATWQLRRQRPVAGSIIIMSAMIKACSTSRAVHSVGSLAQESKTCVVCRTLTEGPEMHSPPSAIRWITFVAWLSPMGSAQASTARIAAVRGRESLGPLAASLCKSVRMWSVTWESGARVGCAPRRPRGPRRRRGPPANAGCRTQGPRRRGSRSTRGARHKSRFRGSTSKSHVRRGLRVSCGRSGGGVGASRSRLSMRSAHPRRSLVTGVVPDIVPWSRTVPSPPVRSVGPVGPEVLARFPESPNK